MSAHIARTSTSFANLPCYCVEGTRVTEARIILMELHSVAIKRLRQETLTAHYLKGKNKRPYFRTDLRKLIKQSSALIVCPALSFSIWMIYRFFQVRYTVVYR
jgi:hypothetical protein